ncbi:NADPH-dependent FMN reductase [Azospirillum canadense]|uniref:NADPH-dependent FMN reductase n=1 Tax=Azospirillum canadense TaxID=403962 RepID=UPI0029CAB9EE|nr:NADPH-dependent FMN reductase [Azospirillum canadense]MCW2241284.1 chromate reductase [Azospirillum canadense]
MTVNVLGISGSLRQGSYNTALLRAAKELAPQGMTIEEFDLAPIPFYNDDVRLQGYPPSVEDLRTRIRQADALLFVTPEYNRSVPGVLKNAIDWASRAPDQPFDDKPVAIMGASMSALGTAFANHHLRQILVYLNAHMLNGPEVLVGGAASKFDAQGRLTDEATRDFVRNHLIGLKRLTLRLKG